jgi:hypothetical protein
MDSGHHAIVLVIDQVTVNRDVAGKFLQKHNLDPHNAGLERAGPRRGGAPAILVWKTAS